MTADIAQVAEDEASLKKNRKTCSFFRTNEQVGLQKIARYCKTDCRQFISPSTPALVPESKLILNLNPILL